MLYQHYFRFLPRAAPVNDEAAGNPDSVQFNFEQDDAGFTPIYADYLAGNGIEEFYHIAVSFKLISTPDAKQQHRRHHGFRYCPVILCGF